MCAVTMPSDSKSVASVSETVSVVDASTTAVELAMVPLLKSSLQRWRAEFIS
jgi:hypothetical protein